MAVLLTIPGVIEAELQPYWVTIRRNRNTDWWVIDREVKALFNLIRRVDPTVRPEWYVEYPPGHCREFRNRGDGVNITWSGPVAAEAPD